MNSKQKQLLLDMGLSEKIIDLIGRRFNSQDIEHILMCMEYAYVAGGKREMSRVLDYVKGEESS